MTQLSEHIRMTRQAWHQQLATGCPAPVEMVAETVSILGKLERLAEELEQRLFAPSPLLSELPENVIRLRPRTEPPSPTNPGPDAA